MRQGGDGCFSRKYRQEELPVSHLIRFVLKMCIFCDNSQDEHNYLPI